MHGRRYGLRLSQPREECRNRLEELGLMLIPHVGLACKVKALEDSVMQLTEGLGAVDLCHLRLAYPSLNLRIGHGRDDDREHRELGTPHSTELYEAHRALHEGRRDDRDDEFGVIESLTDVPVVVRASNRHTKAG